MRNGQSFRAALALGLAAWLLAFAMPAHAEKRVALVIGNNDYKNVPKLQKAVNDARTMGDTLKQLGFSVMVAENQTRQAFSETLLAFDKAVDPGDTAFFFYAGHGFEIAGQNFLLPTDVPAATEGQEELVRDASVLADRVIERLQNKKVRTAILVFDACRNNPFERSGTRAVAGGGGLAPMTQLPEGVFSVFSAGPRQTALDRLSNNDDNPNSVFTRTFAKELLQPGENLVQVAQHTRRIVSEMAETVSHKQIPVYFDQMVDDVFLNGVAKGQSDAPGKPPRKRPGNAEEATKPAAGRGTAARSVPRPAPPNDSVNAPIAAFSRHNGGWSVVFSIADPTLGISWRMGDAGEFRETGFIDTLDPRTRKRMPNPSIELAADAPAATIQVRYVDMSGELQGPFPIKFDPDAALIHDQRKILDMTATSWLSFREFNGLLVYYTHLMSYRCAIREVRVGIDSAVPDKVLKMPPCDPRDPSVIPARCAAISEARALDPVRIGRTDLSRRQRVRNQEFPAIASRLDKIATELHRFDRTMVRARSKTPQRVARTTDPKLTMRRDWQVALAHPGAAGAFVDELARTPRYAAIGKISLWGDER